MDTVKFKIGGFIFSSLEEYEAGVRDANKICAIGKKIDVEDPANAFELYRKLKLNQNVFESIIGEKFIERLYNICSQEIDKELKKCKPSRKTIEIRQESKQIIRNIVVSCIVVTISCGLIIGGYKAIGYTKTSDYGLEYKKISIMDFFGRTKMANTRSILQRDEANNIGQSNATAVVEDFIILDKYKDLYIQNDEMVGWISIDNTIINYPVMQCMADEGDNFYYLNHDFYKNENNNGTLFADTRCDIYAPSTNIIIYGHNMASGKMFGSLKSYKDYDFYREHSIIKFDTLYEENTYEVVGVILSYISNNNDEAFQYYYFTQASNEEEFNEFISRVKRESLYETGINAQYGDDLITLSTCDSWHQDGRLAIIAKKIK